MSCEEMIESEEYKNAVIEKVKAETAEINNKMNQAWYKGRFFIEVVIASLVTSGLVAAWLITYMAPVLSAKNELALLNAETIKKEAEFQKIINKDKTRELNESIESLTEKLNKTLSLNRKIQEQQKQVENKLKKEQKEYSLLLKKYSDKSKSLSKESDQYSNIETLSIGLESKIAALQVTIDNLDKDQKDAKSAEAKLARILTVASLNGLWSDTGKIDGKNVYREFLPKGKIRTFAGVDGDEFTFSNQKWHIENNKIVIITKQNGENLKKIGELKNGVITGTEELPSGTVMKWKSKRVR